MIMYNIVKRRLGYQKNRRIKGETLIKLLILIVTGNGLFYQTLIIFNQFMSGKTVVLLEIGNNQEQKLPTFTMCFLNLYSMEGAKKY